MIDTKKLKGIIAEQNTSQRRLAHDMGITEQTFYRKMKNGVFMSNEIDTMIKLLDIEDPVPIFFNQNVT